MVHSELQDSSKDSNGDCSKVHQPKTLNNSQNFVYLKHKKYLQKTIYCKTMYKRYLKINTMVKAYIQ